MRGHQIDMLHGNLWWKIWQFAIPVIVASCLQQLFVSIDMAVIGRFSSSEALAAIGCTTVLINLLINLFVGMSIGANAVIARYIGQDDIVSCQKACSTTISLSMIGGVFLMFLGIILARPLLEMASTPENIIDMAVLYFRLYFIGMPFTMVYNFGAAILRSRGDTKRPLYILLATGVFHTVLNIILVVCFGMDVDGVGLSLLASNVLNAAAMMYLLDREDDWIRVRIKQLRIYGRELWDIVKIGFPAGIQGVIFSVSNVCIQFAINGFGSGGTAGSAAALTFEYFTFFIIGGFSSACTTFVSQNYGAGQYLRCRKALRVSLISSILACEAIAMVFVFGRSFWLGLITNDPVVVTYAASRMTHVMLFQGLVATYEMSGSALRGIGYSMVPAALTIFGTCIFRVVWVFAVSMQYHDFEVLMTVYPISWIITGCLVGGAYWIISRKKLAETSG